MPGVIKLYKRLKKFLKDKKNIKLNFYSKIPKKKYDILHISDSLQYVEKWENFITDLTKLRPKFIILNNLTAGLIKEYNTYQNFYNEKIFYKFFNIKKVISLFNDYNLEFASPYLNLIKGKYTEYPQPNFKLKDRLGYPCTLIFKLKN